MASIAEWIEKIKTAIYGEEVRGAIWQSLEAMNTEVEAINVDGDQIQTNKTNIATNTAAITALNSRMPWLKEGMPEKRISAKATIDITTTASTKALVMVLSNNIALSALFFVSTTSSGATSIAEVYSGTGLDIAADSFKVSVTNSTSSTAYAYAFIFDGNGMS